MKSDQAHILTVNGGSSSIKFALYRVENKLVKLFSGALENIAEKGLEWVCEHGQIDMLAMLYRPHGFFDNILRGSLTKKMASHIAIPFLVVYADSK